METDAKRFYFTVHPGVLMRGRLPEDCSVMLVASAHWDDRRGRFKVRRPPADHIASLCIDSGGFTAAHRWGTYPWTPLQYAEWARETARDFLPDRLDFVAAMDYACERAVNRAVLRTNRMRIKAGIRNELACRRADPSLPWLPVLQGDTLAERAFDLELRRRIGRLPGTNGLPPYAGIGSVCGRGARAAVEAVLSYRQHLPDCSFHGFGLHVGALDHPAAWFALRSWDSYSWTWPRGAKEGRAGLYLRRAAESRSVYTQRLARLYWRETVLPRLSPPGAQLMLF